MSIQTLPEPAVADTFPINGTDYIEFWVGNAKQSARFYQAVFGFDLVAYRGPETGVRYRASYLLQQEKLRFILTSPLGPEGEIAAHVLKHGDGVRDLAFWVDDARDAHAKAVERGARSVLAPTVKGVKVIPETGPDAVPVLFVLGLGFIVMGVAMIRITGTEK